MLSALVLAFALGSPAAAHPTIDIVATNWHFTPNTITVEAGQSTTLRLTSTSGTHGIASDDLGIAATTISPGRFVEVSFTPRTAGTFAVHCSIFCGAGHPDMVLTVIVTSASLPTPAPTAIPPPAAAPLPTPTAKRTPAPVPTMKPLIDDAHYIVMMVHHEGMELQISQLAVKRAHRAEIRTLAKDLVGRNTAALTQLKSWYKTWYGSSVPAMVPQSSSAMMTNMMRAMSPESLGSAPDFDRAYLAAAIQQDDMGASLSIAAEVGLAHPELRRFARSTTAAQMSDVQKWWHWYNQWYPVK
jgi:uncharacterized protein (DUF305 family)/plastocyanin